MTPDSTFTPASGLRPASRSTGLSAGGADSIFEHVDWLRSLALRLARDEAGADDLVQKAAVVAIRRRRELDGAPRSGVRRWLGQVLHNEARNEWRSARRRSEREHLAGSDARAHANDPAESEERLELTRAVLRAVERLDEPYRTTILARYFDELAVKKIAERERIPVRTVETRLHRGRERLREYLREHAPRRAAWATLVLPSWGGKTAPVAAGPTATWKAPAALLTAAAASAVLVTWQRHDVDTVDNVPTALLELPAATPKLAAIDAPPASRSTAMINEAVDPIPAASATEPATISSMAVIKGRVVTPAGDPLPGAAFRLYSYAPWTHETHADELPINDVPILYQPRVPRGHVANSDADGYFSIEVPIPTAAHVACVVDAGPHRERWSAAFSDRESTLPQLRVGERDLGVITLDEAGAIEGRVIDSQGHPIAMARVTPGSSPGTTYGIAKFTDENGRFVAGHAPAGTLNVRASRSGFLLANQGNVVVRRGETTPIADIILETAPIIGGRVRDPNGAPIAGVVVGGWPKIDGAGRYARAITDAEGRFEIALPQMAPFAIGAKKRGYQTWGDEEDRTRTTEPGTLDLEITLVPVEPIVLRVVDAESGLPVELFGCHLLGDQGEDGLLPLSVPAEAAPLRPRPDGEISVPGREGLDAYAIYIEGMSPFTGTLYRDRVEAPHMEIRVSAQPSLQGQLVRSGSPIAGATVSAIPGTKQQPYYAAGPTGETANERAERLVMLRERSLRRFKPDQLQEVRGTTDENGFFTLEGLKPTAHSLRFTDENAVSTRVYPIDLSDGSVDLGAVEFTGPGAIQGQLLVPAGMDPSGLKVELMSMDRRRYATSDSAGRFEFADVDQGLHELLCQGRAGDLARSSPVPVEVPGGGTGTVDLDLLGSALTPIQLTLRMDGEPVAGASVFARNTESPDAFSPQLGDSDENGVVSGFVSGSGTLQLGMQLNGVMLPKESLPPITYQHGFPVDEMIDVRVAELSITLPPDVHIPNEGELHLTLHTEGSLLGVTTVKTQVSGGAPTGYGSSAVTIEGQTITFGLLPQLAVRASLDVTSSDGGERTLRPLPGLTIETPRWPSVFEAVFEVDGSTGAFAPVILTR